MWRCIHTLRDNNLAVEIHHRIGRDRQPWYSIRIGASPFEDDDEVLPFIPVRDVSTDPQTVALDDTCAALIELIDQAGDWILAHKVQWLANQQTAPRAPQHKGPMRPGKTQRDREKRNARNVQRSR